MQWEFDFLYLLQEMHNPVLDKIMLAFTTLGDAGIVWIVLALIMMWSKKYRKCGVTMAMALIVMLIFGNGILKNIFMRDRPCWIDESVALLIKMPHDYSFPSGHTFSSFASACVLMLYNKKHGIAALVLACLIAFSRMYLFVHFPTDIITSVFLGILVAVLSYIVVNKYYDSAAAKISEKLNKKH